MDFEVKIWSNGGNFETSKGLKGDKLTNLRKSEVLYLGLQYEFE